MSGQHIHSGAPSQQEAVAVPNEGGRCTIRCEQLTKIYRSLVALRRTECRAIDFISLSIGPGRITGLIGPNGAGKTTLLSLLAGFLRPSSGGVEICGHPPRSLEARRRLGYVPACPVFPNESAENILRYHGALLGMPSREAKNETGRCLECMGLHEARQQRVKKYSQGMRQRLALAVALLGRPKVLLLDEPTNSLDPSGVILAREALQAAANQGAAVLISSHRLEELERLVSDCLYLSRGRIVTPKMASAETQCQILEIALLPPYTAIVQQALSELHLEKNPDGLFEGQISSKEEVPAVVCRLVQAGARIAGVGVRKEGLEEAYVRTYHS